MPPTEKPRGVYQFEILRKFSRPRSYIITRQYRMGMASIISKSISVIMGGKQ